MAVRARTRSRGGKGGGAASVPMRFVSVQNRPPQAEQTFTGYDRVSSNWLHVLGTDVTEINIGEQGWKLGESANAYDFTIRSMSVNDGTNFAPVYWSGSRSKTVVAGFNNYISDSITAAQLGYVGFIPRGTLIWIKSDIEYGLNNSLPHNTMIGTSDTPNTQYRPYNSSATTPSTTDAVGVYTWTGVAPTFSFGAHVSYLLGKPVTDTLVYLGIGDSVLTGIGDEQDQNEYGRGMFQRAMQSGSFTNPVPSLNFAQSGYTYDNYTGSNTNWTYWAQFTNRGIEQLAINSINGGTSLVNIQNGCLDIWANMKSNMVALSGDIKILRTRVSPVATSSDSFATEVNQTVGANYISGAKADQLSDWFLTQIGTTIDAVCNLSSIRGVDEFKFVVNGVANRATQDGTHLYDNGANGVGSQLAANDIRADRITLG